jgi:excisionase family DNA binding protein
MKSNVLDSAYYTVAGASEVTGIDRHILYALIHAGNVKAEPRRGRWLIDAASLGAWLEALPVAITDQPALEEAAAKFSPIEIWECNRAVQAAAGRWAGLRLL